jgi:hypothetical protein
MLRRITLSMTVTNRTPAQKPASYPLIDPHEPAPSSATRDLAATGTLIASYAPQMVTPRWINVHDFTVTSVAEMATPRKKSEHRAYLSCVSGLVHWSVGTGSLALDRAEIFHPDTIFEYMQTVSPEMAHDVYSRTRRLLLQMSETLAHAEVTDAPPPGYGLTNTSPFAAADFQGLADWAESLSSPGRRRDAEAMLAFCGGAGLTGAELFNARAQDLVFRDDGVFIFVPGDSPRSVPVNAQWEHRVRARFMHTPPLAHLVRPSVSRRRRLYNGVTPGMRSVAVDAAQLSARLRDTWFERASTLVGAVTAGHFAGHAGRGGPAAARAVATTIDFAASAAILRGAGRDW